MKSIVNGFFFIVFLLSCYCLFFFEGLEKEPVLSIASAIGICLSFLIVFKPLQGERIKIKWSPDIYKIFLFLLFIVHFVERGYLNFKSTNLFFLLFIITFLSLLLVYAFMERHDD